jgi:YHS domain-containing protein
MATAGAVTEGIFRLFGAVPTSRSLSVAKAHFEWNYTTYLDFVFIVVALVVWWLARHRIALGGGVGYAIDPVCAMQVRTADAPASIIHGGATFYFCSDRCAEKFQASPDRFLRSTTMAAPMAMSHDASSSAIDPVCGMTVDPMTAAAKRSHEGTDVWFCGLGCAEQFDANPGAFTPSGSHDHLHG